MIPYEELVTALTNWRAKQGLPVSAISGAAPGSGPTPASGPTVSPGSGPVRSAPPTPPPRAGAYQPPPLASPDTADDSLDVDDAALIEEAHYENEGNDFAMSFGGGVEKDEESTTLGTAPERDSFGGQTELDPKAKTRKPW
jgi:hypothetical protein